MRIVELGDNSMVVMKDSEDSTWESVGDIYRKAVRLRGTIIIDKEQITYDYLKVSEYVYTAGRLVLFFKEQIPPRFQLHDKVVLSVIY